MGLTSRVPIGIRAGYATSSTCKLGVYSLFPGEVTVTCNGVTYPVTLSAIGTDRGANVNILLAELATALESATTQTAGYVGSTTITVPEGFAQWSYSAVQVGNSGSVTGSFYTAPTATDDFALFFAGCDNNASYSGFPVSDGYWPYIKDYAENGALPVVGVLFVDDHGYVDLQATKDDGTGGTGHKVSRAGLEGEYPAYDGKVYDYALGYLANLGLMGSERIDTGSVSNDKFTAFGRSEYRVWCNQNLNLLPQWGDHEFYQDIGWDYATNYADTVLIHGVDSSNVTGATLFATGKTAWDAFMLPLQPPSRDESGALGDRVGGDTSANHWGASYGCVTIVCPDGISNTNAVDVSYGTAQIDDCLTYIAAQGNSFTILGMANGIRKLVDEASAFGTQQPLFNDRLTEYQRLFTSSTGSPQSLMQLNYTNGSKGALVTIHGDYHKQMATKNLLPAYDTQLAENFYSVWNGTTNGSANFLITGHTVGEALTSYDGGSVLVYENPAFIYNGGHKWGGTRIEVYGSRNPKEMHVVLLDMTDQEVWRGRWLARSGNDVVPTTWEKAQTKGAARAKR